MSLPTVYGQNTVVPLQKLYGLAEWDNATLSGTTAIYGECISSVHSRIMPTYLPRQTDRLYPKGMAFTGLLNTKVVVFLWSFDRPVVCKGKQSTSPGPCMYVCVT